MAQHRGSLSAEMAGFRGIAPALLEGWMRDYYFDTEIDLGSSGVQSFALGDVRRLSGLAQEEMDRMVFDDSRTQGAAGLREAVARRWGDGNPDRVMATHGSSEAIYLIMNALLRAGDEVVVLEPCYQQLASIAEAIGCRVKRWRLPAERNFAADVEDLKTLISPRTRMVVVNFPHNPTGASLTPGGQRDLIRAVAGVGAYLVWDAAFSDLVFAGEPLPNPAMLYERAISLGTLSKAYGLAGLRVGWLFAAPDVISACIHLRDYVTLHLSPLVELIAQKAIESGDSLLSIRLAQARKNLEALRGWVLQYEQAVEWVEPRGGVCAFPRLRFVEDSAPFCRELAQRYNTLLVPGTCFNHPAYVRLGFGGPPDAFTEGLHRLTALLKTKTHIA